MALTYAYYYAVIDLETGEVLDLQDTTDYADPALYPDYIAIPEYNEAYFDAYYNQADKKWYEDAAFTIEATELNG